jgi:hypothetical protein
MKQRMLLIILILGTLALGAACSGSSGRAQQRQTASQNNMAKTTVANPTPAKRAALIPPYQTGVSLKNLLPTLPPEAFSGSVRNAYAIAKEIPQTLAQLPCYCGCDKSVKHKSLHSCYVDSHASGCGVCMNEAFTAYKLQKEQKLNADQIREKIINEYAPKN